MLIGVLKKLSQNNVITEAMIEDAKARCVAEGEKVCADLIDELCDNRTITLEFLDIVLKLICQSWIDELTVRIAAFCKERAVLDGLIDPVGPELQLVKKSSHQIEFAMVGQIPQKLQKRSTCCKPID